VFDRVSEEHYEFESQQSTVSEEENKLRKLLNMSVNEIELSVRAANCLNNANITTVGELSMKTEQEMLKYRNFARSRSTRSRRSSRHSACPRHEVRRATARKQKGSLSRPPDNAKPPNAKSQTPTLPNNRGSLLIPPSAML